MTHTTIARALLLVALTSAACSRGTCRDSAVPAPPPPPPRPPGDAERTLTLDEAESVIWSAAPQAVFAETSAIEHEAIAALVPRLLEGARAPKPPDPRAWQREATAAGMQIEVWRVAGGTYWALLEAPGHARGAGAYVFRVAPADADEAARGTILLQAPHNLFDLGTGRLALELLFGPPPGPRPRALFTNTIHRYQLAPGDKQKRRINPADVAHNPAHAFSIATEAFALAAGPTRVLQLHGFGSRSDNDDDGEGEVKPVAAVISAGDELGSSPLTTALARALAAEFGEVVRFPEDVRFLGATTNAQGRMLRKLERVDFVHLEMSADLRKQLAGSAAARGKLGAILFGTAAP